MENGREERDKIEGMERKKEKRGPKYVDCRKKGEKKTYLVSQFMCSIKPHLFSVVSQSNAISSTGLSL